MNMDTATVTVIIPLKLAQRTQTILLRTMRQYTESFNRVCQIGWQQPRINGVALHHLTYYGERESTDLPSQLVVSARTKATEALKSAKTKQKKKEKVRCPQSKRACIRYDQRTMTLNFDKRKVTLSSLKGRMQAKLLIPKYAEKYLEWKPRSADLCLHKNGKLHLHLVFEKAFERKAIQKVVGIDLGVNRPAVTSECDFYGERRWKEVENRYFRLKRKLQAKGTKSAKRHLKKIAQKVNRFRTDCDHVLSKRLVTAYGEGTLLVLEDLTDIRKRVKVRKKQRRRIHAWSFARLKSFLEYKAIIYGCQVDYVDPRYTSQKCSKCEYIDKRNRKTQSEFVCKRCEFKHNADLNAAKNIRLNHLASSGISVGGGPQSIGLS